MTQHAAEQYRDRIGASDAAAAAGALREILRGPLRRLAGRRPKPHLVSADGRVVLVLNPETRRIVTCYPSDRGREGPGGDLPTGAL